MKLKHSILMLLFFLLPPYSWAQSQSQAQPQAPASWIEFQQKQSQAQIEFFKKMRDDREAFLKANPDARAYVAQMSTLSRTRFEKWKADHLRTHIIAPNPPTTTGSK